MTDGRAGAKRPTTDQGRGAEAREAGAGSRYPGYDRPTSGPGALPPIDVAARADSRQTSKQSVPFLAVPHILRRRDDKLQGLTKLSANIVVVSPRSLGSPTSFALRGPWGSVKMMPSCPRRDVSAMEEDSGAGSAMRRTSSMPGLGRGRLAGGRAPLRPTASDGDPSASPARPTRPRKVISLPLGATGGSQERRESPAKRRVSFSPPSLDSAHEVTPYARKYGVHPRFFEFDRRGEMRLTDAGIVEDIRRVGDGLGKLKLPGREQS